MQSHVPEHTRLAWLLECTATMGELRRMTQFKEKSDGQETVRAGLFTYPVLMAADILLYDADVVPVGDDQRQHLELARELAIRFNNRYGETFTVPEAAIPGAAARVMDLQHPERKMSKSVESPLGTIGLLDSAEEITRKVRKAVTDTDGEVRYDRAAKPGLANLLDLLAAATGRTPQEVAIRLHPLRRPQEGRGRGPRRAAPPGARAPGRAGGDPAYVDACSPRARPGPTGWLPPPTQAAEAMGLLRSLPAECGRREAVRPRVGSDPEDTFPPVVEVLEGDGDAARGSAGRS